MLFRNYRNYQSCPPQLEHHGLLSQELSSQVSAFSFWGSSLIFLLGALSISPLTDARVCVRELLTAFEVINQLMSKTN